MGIGTGNLVLYLRSSTFLSSVFCVNVLPFAMTWNKGCPKKLTNGNQKVRIQIFDASIAFSAERGCTLQNNIIIIWMLLWWKNLLSISNFPFYVIYLKKTFSFIFSLVSLLKINVYRKLPDCHNITFISCNPKLLPCLMHIGIKTERNFRDQLA